MTVPQLVCQDFADTEHLARIASNRLVPIVVIGAPVNTTTDPLTFNCSCLDGGFLLSCMSSLLLSSPICQIL